MTFAANLLGAVTLGIFSSKEIPFLGVCPSKWHKWPVKEVLGDVSLAVVLIPVEATLLDLEVVLQYYGHHCMEILVTFAPDSTNLPMSMVTVV